ncbi:hypothetical protein MRB53_033051 [Persea americana]|uniref:Uncharacterized protein n=1 Tax=Persea americana TaxID=3435 RepID=A0ACC2KTE2_PERAE|nr:hypothetical protein MRB53_033051 [Persea americana]
MLSLACNCASTFPCLPLPGHRGLGQGFLAHGLPDYPFQPCHNAAEEDGDPREFPVHEEAYIDGFATHHLLLDLVRFRSQCIRVGSGGRRRDERVVDWKKTTATTRDFSEETTKSDMFEAVVICDGYDTGGG